MLFTTATQWFALFIAFVAGWLFGLASHPGGRKWKQRYADERAAHAESRRATDARVADVERDHAERLRAAEARVADAEARHRELERDHARLASAAPVTAATVAPTSSRTEPPRRSPALVIHPDGTRRSWFDWGDRRP